jgi:hypothetical protein
MSRSRRLERHPDFGAWRRAWLGLLSGKVRAERDRRLGIERNLDRAKLLERLQVAVHTSERRFLVGLGKVDSEDLLSAVERVLGDPQRRIRLLDEGGRRESASDSGRDGLEEPPAAGAACLPTVHAVSRISGRAFRISP